MSIFSLQVKVKHYELTLEDWIEILMHRELVFPEYCRNFVWDKERVINFVDSMNAGFHVPSLTIGIVIDHGKRYSYLVDGQQRLTAIMLAYMSLFPKVALENKSHNWTLEALTSLGSTRDSIKNNMDHSLYERIDYNTTVAFYRYKTIGCNFLVPNRLCTQEHVEYYENLYRKINQGAVPL